MQNLHMKIIDYTMQIIGHEDSDYDDEYLVNAEETRKSNRNSEGINKIGRRIFE